MWRWSCGPLGAAAAGLSRCARDAPEAAARAMLRPVSAGFGMRLRLVARPGREDGLAAALMEVDAALRRVPACLLHAVGRPEGEGRAVEVVEAWTDRGAHARWRAGPAADRLVERVRAAAEGPPEVLEIAWRGGKGLPPN